MLCVNVVNVVNVLSQQQLQVGSTITWQQFRTKKRTTNSADTRESVHGAWWVNPFDLAKFFSRLQPTPWRNRNIVVQSLVRLSQCFCVSVSEAAISCPRRTQCTEESSISVSRGYILLGMHLPQLLLLVYCLYCGQTSWCVRWLVFTEKSRFTIPCVCVCVRACVMCVCELFIDSGIGIGISVWLWFCCVFVVYVCGCVYY